MGSHRVTPLCIAITSQTHKRVIFVNPNILAKRLLRHFFLTFELLGFFSKPNTKLCSSSAIFSLPSPPPSLLFSAQGDEDQSKITVPLPSQLCRQ